MPSKATMIEGIAITAALSMAGFALKWQFEANARLARIEQRQAEITDEKQDKTLSRHWRLLGWTRDQINADRARNGLPLVSWPETGD